MKSDSIFPFIVADIGGTNARFGLVQKLDKDTGRLCIESQKVYSCDDFESLQVVMNEYLSDQSEQTVRYACIAIAGPVISDRVSMTNLNWSFSVESLKSQFNLKDLQVINDFGAQAYATLYLNSNDLQVLVSGVSRPDATRLVIGPGTGLGVASLVKASDDWYPICGEGGHIAFAPTNSKEMELINVLRESGSHISVESLVSGPGLSNIYSALIQLNGMQLKHLTPAEISRSALKGDDPISQEAVLLFCKILGSTSGDIALITGAFGGVYLSGGILPRIESFLATSQLTNGFSQKGAMTKLMETVPIYLVTTDTPALAGAAHWYYDIKLRQR